MGDFRLLEKKNPRAFSYVTGRNPPEILFSILNQAINEAFNLDDRVGSSSRDQLGFEDCREVDGSGREFGIIKQTYVGDTYGAAGGSGFYWQLKDADLLERESMTIKYDMKFGKDFDWVKGRVQNNFDRS